MTGPDVVDRTTWQAELDALRVREKAHTRAGDAIAAARRRLPMVEVDASTPLIGAEGEVPLLAAFEGRSQLIAYFQMWHTGMPFEQQCEGCTFYNGQVRELAYLHSRDITYATFCKGPYEESVRYRDFMEWNVPWYSVQDSTEALQANRASFVLAGYLREGDRVFETYWTTGRGVEIMAPSYGLMDMTPFGRQETWEDTPAGRPRPFVSTGGQFTTEGRPTAQLSRNHAAISR